MPPIKSNLSDWEFKDGLLYLKGRNYVGPDIALRKEIVRQHHDTIPAGHPGQRGTHELVS